MARNLSASLSAPPIVGRWLDVIETAMGTDAEALPQLCVGSSAGAGKLYLVGTPQGGVRTAERTERFPDLPVNSAGATLHSSVLRERAAGGARVTEAVSIEWPLRRPAGRKD